MGVANYLVLLLTHPLEFRTLVQYKLYHANQRDLTAVREHPTSGWDRHSMRRCWHYLDLTSRSFSAVIKELEGDLARTVSYLLGTARSVPRTDVFGRADLSFLPRPARPGYH
jgi:farnesyl-diphosphate farnesyltransferase